MLQFGDPKRVIAEPGLQVKIPFIQNVVFLDRRILSLDPQPEEVIAYSLYMATNLLASPSAAATTCFL